MVGGQKLDGGAYSKHYTVCMISDTCYCKLLAESRFKEGSPPNQPPKTISGRLVVISKAVGCLATAAATYHISTTLRVHRADDTRHSI
jgi:hypothetical protein